MLGRDVVEPEEFLNKIEIVVVGTSAGGVDALKTLFEVLPKDFELPILIVQHFPESAKSILPQILSRLCGRLCKHGENGEPILPGVAYIAPPGSHMLVQDGRILLARGPKENSVRPAIDPLFRSAAQCYGDRLAAVLMSGLLDDGTLGMAIVKRRNGVTFAQDPEEASYGDMPRSAIKHGLVDYVMSVREIAALLSRFAVQKLEENVCNENGSKDPVQMNADELKGLEHRSPPSAYTCPECHGTLFELDEGNVLHFRCRVGHAYSAEKLFEQQVNNLEGAIWIALRILEENNDLLRAMVARSVDAGRQKSVAYFNEKIAFNMQQISYLSGALDTGLRSPLPPLTESSIHNNAN